MTKGLPYDKLAELYDSLMDGKKKFYDNYYRFVVKVSKDSGVKLKNILEMACGTGNLTKIFDGKGYDIEGLDASKGMLNVAKKKGLNVRLGNMTNFHLDKRYDLILCIFDSLNYMKSVSDLQKCFKGAYRHLKENGLFIFDMNSEFKINKTVPDFTPKYHKFGNTEMIWLNSYEKNKWISEMIIFRKSNGRYDRYYEKHVENSYRMSYVKRSLANSGFRLVGLYSDLEFDKVKNDSRRWFFVAKKK